MQIHPEAVLPPSTVNVECIAFPLQLILKSWATESFKWVFCYVINIQTRVGNCSLWLILLTGGMLGKVLTGGYVFYVLMLLMYNVICPKLELRHQS